MPEKAINKVVYGNQTLIDITDTTATTSDVLEGKYFYNAAGVKTLGTAAAVNNQDKSVIPTQSTQILTADPGHGYTGLGTVTVEPIPSNYGLITWNGSVLTVS